MYLTSKDDNVIICPEAEKQSGWNANSSYGALTNGPLSWPYNGQNPYHANFFNNPAKLTQIKKNSETILFADSRSTNTPQKSHYLIKSVSTYSAEFANRHNKNQSNIVYTDGHVAKGNTQKLNLWVQSGLYYTGGKATGLCYGYCDWSSE